MIKKLKKKKIYIVDIFGPKDLNFYNLSTFILHKMLFKYKLK